MFDKVNVFVIIKDHVATLKDYSTGRYRYSDFLLFLGLPLASAGLLLALYGALEDTPITVVATSLSIFAALLFNLLLLIYDAIRKPDSSSGHRDLRRRFLQEVFSNISFAILIAIIAIVFVLLLVLVNEDGAWAKLLSFVVYSLVASFILTLLMVLKRVHVLVAKEFGDT